MVVTWGRMMSIIQLTRHSAICVHALARHLGGVEGLRARDESAAVSIGPGYGIGSAFT